MNFVLWGEDKSCKNTLALTFPKPLVDMEFDIGGFTRSCRNLPHLPIKDWFDKDEIKLEQYIIPMQIQLEDAMNVRPSKLVVGMKELFYQFAGGFIKLLQLPDSDIKSIMVDTGTLLYDITCQGYLQELQEKQGPFNPETGKCADGKPLIVSLHPPVLYREPYIRMRGFAYQAKAHGKHLIMTHHASDEYGLVHDKDGKLVEGKTGKRVLHGWAQWGDSADVIGHTYWNKADMKPYFTVELAEVKELEGITFQEPTFDKIQTTIKMLRGEA